jgi:GTP-binding protein
VNDAFTDEDIEAARVMFARPVTFMMGCAKIEQLPDADLPEVAFAGRSNVGKSSLINALTGQNHLARASNEPGRTREVNFFCMDGLSPSGGARLVDLPGYGFAVAGKKTTQQFQNLGRDYLRGRVNLKRVYLLIDARHGLKAVDTEALDALDLAAVSYQIVLTKADKLRSFADVVALQAATLKAISKRPAAFPRVAATSSEKGIGIPELRAEVAAAVAP